MATGNLFLGTARRKLGDVVLYRTGGKQRSRVRVIPKNPKSAKQAIQRMVLATAAKMASAFEPIVNHSFQGVPVGAKSVQLFRQKAMNALRSAAAYAIDQTIEDSPAADFAIKGSPIIGALEGLQVSRGALSMQPFTASTNALDIALTDALSATAITTQEAYAAELAKFGLTPGDQLTYIVLSQNNSEIVASAIIGESTENDFAQQIGFCRVTFKAELPDNFSGTLLDGTAINPALIEESFGALPAFSDETLTAGHVLRASFAGVLATGYVLMTAGAIRSQRNGSDWDYSTCFMVRDVATLDANDATPTYMTYMDGVATIEVGGKYYLQHAVATPFAAGE